MRRLKHILLATALLAALLPCSHASTHSDHADESPPVAVAFDAAPCECHTCDLQPCSEDFDLRHDRSAEPALLAPLLLSLERYPFPTSKTVPPPTPAALPNALANLRTVQLLI